MFYKQVKISSIVRMGEWFEECSPGPCSPEALHLCWETLGPAIHVEVNLTHEFTSTCLNIVADQIYYPFMTMVFPGGSGLMHPATLHKLFRNGLRNMVKSSSCPLASKFPKTQSK